MTTVAPRFTIYKLRNNINGIFYNTTSLTEAAFNFEEFRKPRGYIFQ
jgi:hypothetical protein